MESSRGDDDKYGKSYGFDWRFYYKNKRRNEEKKAYRRFASKEIQGNRIDCPIGKWKFLIDECMRRRTGLEDRWLEFIYFLASLDRAFTIKDIQLYAPSGKKRMTYWYKDWLFDNGYARDFMGHSMNHNRIKSYELTTEARNIYTMYVRYCFQLSKMPIHGLGKDWELRPIERDRTTFKQKDWYSSVMAYNDEVEKRMEARKLYNDDKDEETKE